MLEYTGTIQTQMYDEQGKEGGTRDTVLRTTYWFLSSTGPDKWKVLMERRISSRAKWPHAPEDRPEGPARYSYYDLEINQQGQQLNKKAVTSQTPMILPLPADFKAAEAGWDSGSADDTLFHSQLVAPNEAEEGRYTVKVNITGGLMSETYGFTKEATYQFDARRGLFTTMHSTGGQSYGFNSKNRGEDKLTSSAQLEPKQLQRLEAEFAAYGELMKKMSEDIPSFAEEAASALPKLDAVMAMMKSEAEKWKDSRFYDSVQSSIARLKEQRKYVSSRQYRPEKPGPKVGEPGPDWTATSLTGQEFSNASLRGKVVILDFWYRGCGWCIRAMPQIKEVAEHYKKQPVAVLGMTTDRKEEDAQFIVDKLKLTYPNLRIPQEFDPKSLSRTGVSQDFGVRGFPTVIILDQDGVIRWKHSGYTPELKAMIIAEVDKLLES